MENFCLFGKSLQAAKIGLLEGITKPVDRIDLEMMVLIDSILAT